LDHHISRLPPGWLTLEHLTDGHPDVPDIDARRTVIRHLPAFADVNVGDVAAYDKMCLLDVFLERARLEDDPVERIVGPPVPKRLRFGKGLVGDRRREVDAALLR